MIIIDESTRSLPIIAIIIFTIAYALVIFEEFVNLKKSKPMILASGIIWIIVAIIAKESGQENIMKAAFTESILEYSK